MKVINRNSVNLLFERAEGLQQSSHDSWRCIYFKFSDKPERNNHTLYNNFVVKAITDILEDTGGYIYLCDDADIFVMFQGALKPVLAKLGNHFADLNPERMENQDDGLCSVFDLGKQWQEFYNLCEAKYFESVISEEARAHIAHYGRSVSA